LFPAWADEASAVVPVGHVGAAAGCGRRRTDLAPPGLSSASGFFTSPLDEVIRTGRTVREDGPWTYRCQLPERRAELPVTEAEASSTGSASAAGSPVERETAASPTVPAAARATRREMPLSGVLFDAMLSP
jgi:hypothetical protein